MQESSLDKAQLTKQLEKETEVHYIQLSGTKPSSSMKRKSSHSRTVIPICNNWQHTSLPTKAGTTPSEKVYISKLRLHSPIGSLRCASIPPSSGLWS